MVLLQVKRRLADRYAEFFEGIDIPFFREPQAAHSNYWLNAVILPDLEERDRFLEMTNNAGVMTRPIWRLTNRLPMFEGCRNDGLETSRWLADRVVNIPSSVPGESAIQGLRSYGSAQNRQHHRGRRRWSCESVDQRSQEDRQL